MTLAARDVATRSRVWLTDDQIAPALLLIALGTLAFITPAQNDTWWHLGSGREMWRTGSLLHTEPFSHTAFGAELHNDWWLSQLLFYGLFSLGGPMLLTAFAGACAFAAVAGSWRLARASWEVRLLLLFFLALITPPEWAVRPQVLSLALLVLAAYLIRSDRVVWLPLVCVVWANAHPMVVFGVLMAGACVVESLIWSRARFARASVIAACCAAAPLISSDGWQYWPQVLRTVSISHALQLQEYRASIDLASAPFWIVTAVLVVLVIRQRGALAGWPRSDRILLIAAVLLAVAAFGAVRNVPFFAVIATPVLARLLSGNPVNRRSERPAGTSGYALVATAGMVSLATVVAGWSDGGT